MTGVGIAIGIGIEFYGGPRLFSKRDSDSNPEGDRRRLQLKIQPDKARRVWKTLAPPTGNTANDN